MNRYMLALDAKGVSLGYTKVTKASDPVTIPDGAIEGLVFNLAKRLAQSYDMPITPSLMICTTSKYGQLNLAILKS